MPHVVVNGPVRAVPQGGHGCSTVLVEDSTGPAEARLILIYLWPNVEHDVCWQRTGQQCADSNRLEQAQHAAHLYALHDIPAKH